MKACAQGEGGDAADAGASHASDARDGTAASKLGRAFSPVRLETTESVFTGERLVCHKLCPPRCLPRWAWVDSGMHCLFGLVRREAAPEEKAPAGRMILVI